MLDRFYVRRLDFRPAVPVDQFQPGEGATAVIGFQDMFAKNAAAADARDRLFGPDPLAVFAEPVLVFREAGLGGRLGRAVGARQELVFVREPGLQNACEIAVRYWPDRPLYEAPVNRPSGLARADSRKPLSLRKETNCSSGRYDPASMTAMNISGIEGSGIISCTLAIAL